MDNHLMDNKKTILIVEDEIAIRDVLKYALSRFYLITEAETIKDAKKMIAIKCPDLIILDWMLPDKSGIELIKELKKTKNHCEIPIIMLTAKAEEENKIKGLETGADDYITKPFSTKELLARIKTILRRGKVVVRPDDVINYGEIVLNQRTFEVIVQGKPLSFTKSEYKLLHFFMMHQESVCPREKLLHAIQREELDVDNRAIDALVKRLRKKLQPFGIAHYVITIRGEGYMFKNDTKERYGNFHSSVRQGVTTND